MKHESTIEQVRRLGHIPQAARLDFEMTPTEAVLAHLRASLAAARDERRLAEAATAQWAARATRMEQAARAAGFACVALTAALVYLGVR